MTIIETKTRLDADKEYIPAMLRSINQNFAPKTIQIPLSNGESFFANGHVQRIPRGDVDARFVPKRGTINNATVTPPVPARVPMQSFRVPKGVGAVIVVDYLEFLVNLKATEEFANLIERMVEYDRIQTARQDVDFTEDTLTAIQIDPQAVGARLRAACMTKTTTRTGIKTTRIRGWSRA